MLAGEAVGFRSAARPCPYQTGALGFFNTTAMVAQRACVSRPQPQETAFFIDEAQSHWTIAGTSQPRAPPLQG